MPRSKAFSNSAVTNYLALVPRSSVQQIADVTGLSKATVYRVVRSNPAIKMDNHSARTPTYSVDLELMQERIKAIEDTAPKPKPTPVELDPKVKERLEILLGMPLAEAIDTLTTTANRVGDGLNELIRAQHYSQALQSGQAEPSVVQWTSTRERLEAVTVFADTLSAYARHYLDHPQSKSPDWWAIFPKEP